MTPRQSQALYERKMNARGKRCPVCGRQMIAPQLAHLVSQSKANIKKYGKEFIHSELNTMLVCGLKCNNSVQLSPATHPREVNDLYSKWLDVIR